VFSQTKVIKQKQEGETRRIDEHQRTCGKRLDMPEGHYWDTRPFVATITRMAHTRAQAAAWRLGVITI
jgi:hypothetical protein